MSEIAVTQKIKQVLALKGKANVGKSSTLQKMFALLSSAYPSGVVRTINTVGQTFKHDVSG